MTATWIWTEQCLNCGSTSDTRIVGSGDCRNPIGSGTYRHCPTCQTNGQHVIIHTAYREGPVADTIQPSKPQPPFAATETFGEVIRAIDKAHLEAARETPPNQDYMRALQNLGHQLELALHWHRIGQPKHIPTSTE